MTAEIIPFPSRRVPAAARLTAAEATEARRLFLNPAAIEAQAAREGSRPSEVLLTFQLFETLERKLGIQTGAQLRASEAKQYAAHHPELIQEIADNYGIDTEAPFQAKPKEPPLVVPVKLVGRKPPRPRKGGAK